MTAAMYEEKSYIEHFGKVGSGMHVINAESRKIKAKKIFAIIKEQKRDGLQGLSCLDIGCSVGLITRALSNEFKTVTGIDPDKKAIEIAKKQQKKKNVQFIVGSALQLPLKQESFDVVICNHIYEHVPDAKKLFEEIYRVLRRGGVCYFAAGNKFNLLEPHYKLPLLSWFPNWMGSIYLRITGKGKKYEEKHLSYIGIKKLLKKFVVRDMTLQVLKNPEKYHIEDNISAYIKRFPKFFFILCYPFLPTYLLLAIKPHERLQKHI